MRFRGHQASSADVFRSLEPVYRLLKELGERNALDGKLAEYAFFPLSHIFNEARRLSVRCLETAIECLQILVLKGWKQALSPQLGKQLIILLALIIGERNMAGQQSQRQPEELAIAGFNCFTAIFDVLDGPVAKRTIYNEVGEATVLDQTLYILLEGLSDSRSDHVRVAAAEALHAVFKRITDRVVLASVTPRTVSALTRILKPTTQTRHSYRLLDICLRVLTYILRALLNDLVVASAVEKTGQDQSHSEDITVLDSSWLKATATQINLALANVVKIRRHQRPEVQNALLELCTMVIEDCQMTLKTAIPMMVETMVVLSDVAENQAQNRPFSTLKTLAITYPVVVDTLKESLQNWIVSFPRTMQSNDETAKQWGIRQISTTFQILSELHVESDMLTTNLTSGLCDSVAAAFSLRTSSPVVASYNESGGLDISMLSRDADLASFPPVVLEQRSQQQTLKDLQSMVSRLNVSDSGNEIARSIVNRVHGAIGESILPPFWLSLTFLRNTRQIGASFDEFISLDALLSPSSASPFTRAGMIEELYYISLPLLNRPAAEVSSDWRVSVLALEAIALQAKQLGEAFRPELLDSLYPTLQLLASGNHDVQKHSMACLNILTSACNYASAGSMIIENADYLVNALALKLNTFDVSPYPAQVLLMIVRLCGASLIPYLDDLVDSIFGILDMYHGYPALVAVMFRALTAIVEEGAKVPSLLAISDINGSGREDHLKRRVPTLSVSTLVEDLAGRKAKHSNEDIDDGVEYMASRHPMLTEPRPGEQAQCDVDQDSLQDEADEPFPPPREPSDVEKPLSKPHILLLHIVRSTVPHLSTPSPYLRRSLLAILEDVLPVLALNENSFLPLINELWPSVSTKITFPSSFANSTSFESSLSAVDQPQNEDNNVLDYQEETFVVVGACHAVEAMCKGAGDFMASRIEHAFPQWHRLYVRAWDKVRQYAEKAIEHRSHQQRNNDPGRGWSDMRLGLGIASLSSTARGGGETPSRGIVAPFTPHHKLWRALTCLFITILSHVRLPLLMGDQICESLGAWIALFAGPDYYFDRHATNAVGKMSDSVRHEISSVEGAICAMEVWNADLTWFIFQQQRIRVRGIVAAESGESSSASSTPLASSGCALFGGKVNFARVAFY